MTDWQKESLCYDFIHPRMRAIKSCLQRLPQRRLLDVGCATARFRTLLPADFTYSGCDIADHAGRVLPSGRFQQLDLNASSDLSYFARQDINVVSAGGVLEYLARPEDFLKAVHKLVGTGGALVASIINFQARQYAAPASHHPAWAFKPTLDELRLMLDKNGWRVHDVIALPGKKGLCQLFCKQLAWYFGVDHPWSRANIQQFVICAEAVGGVAAPATPCAA